MTSDYRPIACGQYDRLEVLAMHRARVRAAFRESPEGGSRELLARVRTTRVGNGAEYLVLVEDDGTEHAVRLDLLQWIEDIDHGGVWRQDSD